MKRKKKKAAKPRVFAVRFTKGQFMVLSLAERELLIRVGLVQNDLLLMQRLWGAHYYRTPRTTLTRSVQAAHSVALLLIFIGKLFEGLLIYEKLFQKQRFHPAYLNQFTLKQRAAATTLKRLLGESSLLANIRNQFAFHYPESDLSEIMDDWHRNRMLIIYFGDPDGNTLNAYAAETFLLSLMKLTGRATPIDALRHIQTEAAKALIAYNSFVAGVQTAAIHRMCGARIKAEICKIRASQFRPHDEFALPFLMGTATNYHRPADQLTLGKRRKNPKKTASGRVRGM
jgi:hypothetical protein